ncbi:MAG: hypothetical protein K9J16_09885 [Melioribacteraceae bacterium]|nr:hypothetical protein [Melioribacteraceae bacterium]MCF8356241.1 hypothetical protein [Melioribacteraceae bacterium]MCF8394988.1 hypothetical protein [Melioribacteraceae bacterium]
MNKLLAVIITLFVILMSGCSADGKLSQSELKEIALKPFFEWNIEDCSGIIAEYKRTNVENRSTTNLSDVDVVVSAIPMNLEVIKAMTMKETLLKRLSNEECEHRLKIYLEEYTNYTYLLEEKQIVPKPTPDSASMKGFSFEVIFENITDPYHPIEILNGYEYFFLENSDGKFSRVAEISGKYVDQDFYLDGFLTVHISFSPFTDEGELIFPDQKKLSGTKLIFNAISQKPIEIEWE